LKDRFTTIARSPDKEATYCPTHLKFLISNHKQTMNKFFNYFVISFVIFSLIGISSLHAQELQGTISGKVTINDSTAIGAKVTLKLIGDRYGTATTSLDEFGRFKFSGYRFGRYTLKVEYSCMKFKRTNIEVNSTKELEIDVAFIAEDCKKKESEEADKWKICEVETSKSSIELSDADKSSIFLELLKDADEDYKIPDYNILLNQSAGIVMLAKDADKVWLKLIPDLNIMILNLAQVNAFAKKRKQDMFVLFFDVSSVGNCAKANIGTGVIIGKKSKKIYLSGGGCGYTFRKQDGKWIGKQETCTIS
jgi:hypothetical protein